MKQGKGGVPNCGKRHSAFMPLRSRLMMYMYVHEVTVLQSSCIVQKYFHMRERSTVKITQNHLKTSVNMPESNRWRHIQMPSTGQQKNKQEVICKKCLRDVYLSLTTTWSSSPPRKSHPHFIGEEVGSGKLKWSVQGWKGTGLGVHSLPLTLEELGLVSQIKLTVWVHDRGDSCHFGPILVWACRPFLIGPLLPKGEEPPTALICKGEYCLSLSSFLFSLQNNLF